MNSKQKAQLKYFKPVTMGHDSVSYSLEDALNMLQKEKEVQQVLLEDNIIDLKQLKLLDSISRIKQGIDQKKESILKVIQEIEKQSEHKEKLIEKNQIKKEALDRNKTLLNKHRFNLSDQNIVLEQTHILNLDQIRMLKQRRKSLINELHSIFPIEKCLDLTNTYTIRDITIKLPLDSVIYFNHFAYPCCVIKEVNHQNLNIALGYLAQLVNCLAMYLNVDLCFPITAFGSETTITNPLILEGIQVFPLYLKRKINPKDFQTATFLFNKNVEQLLNTINLTTTTLSNPLENLNLLMYELMHPE
ncbi:hypothetical protein K502DRAFT_352241 [Neoconidiobolus thromboides FSU 785]|nr:hypothetical protein K502DRAFT_352241 [Neoconidiobolus thromboides FSU 785]